MSTRQPKPWTPERHEACKARAAAATRGPWKWWTSNSHRRLTAGDGQDGGVAYGTKHKDGCGDIVIGEHDMVFIEEARIDLHDALREIERLESSELDLIRKAGEQATRDSLEIERLQRALANHKALLAAAETAGHEVCEERDDARRLVTLERRVGRWMSTEDEEALRRLRQEAREWDGSKVDQPARHTRHDRHCMIHDGVRCSHEPGCEVER